MKKIFAILLVIFTPAIYASEGYTWFSQLIHKFHLPVAEHVVGLIFVSLLLIIGGFIYRSKLAKVPNIVIPDKGISFRNIAEVYGQFIYNQCRMVIGEKETPKYFSFISTVFIVIFISNIIGLVPGFLPPTSHLSTTLAFGVFVFMYYNFVGVKEVGFWNYMKHFAGPLWYVAILLFPLEIISHSIRPVSLAFRLMGNMTGDHLVLATFSDLGLRIHQAAGDNIIFYILSMLPPVLLPMPFYLLGVLVCTIQAYVFTMLTMVYISLATAHQDHGEHA